MNVKLQHFEPECVSDKTDFTGEESLLLKSEEVGCDDCFAGVDCIHNIQGKVTNFDKCYVPLDEIAESKSCGECEDPIFDRDFNNGMYLRAKLYSVPVMLLVDTGASTSLLSAKIYEALPEKLRPPLRPYHKRLIGSNGTEIKSMGWVPLTIHIGDDPVQMRFVVSELNTDQGLLGLPDLRKANMTIRLDKTKLFINDQELPVYKYRHETSKRINTQNDLLSVNVTDTIMIQPSGETVVNATVQSSETIKEQVFMFCPSDSTLPDGVLGTNALSTCKDNQVYVRLININHEPVMVKRGTVLGVVDEVTEVGLNQIGLLSDRLSQTVKGNVQQNMLIRGQTLTKLESDEPDLQLPEYLQVVVDNLGDDLDEQDRTKVGETLRKYQNVFAKHKYDLGCTHLAEHDINTGDHPPIKQNPRRLPLVQGDEARKQIEELLKSGLVKPINSPWASPIVLVKKKDSTLRLCVDYRKLNTVTQKDSFPLPRIDCLLDSLGEGTRFCSLDLAAGYWQTPMTEEAKLKSAFVTAEGLFSFETMPFGLCNAPATFQKLMETVLAGLQFKICVIYLDDILVYGKGVDACLENLGLIFSRLQEAGLRLRPEKCFLLQQKVKYLGHIVSADGVAVDPSKYQVVEDWPVPNNLKEVQSFLGFLNYYRKFIKEFASVAKPLTMLTRKGIDFEWTPAAQVAFQILKKKLITAPIMAYPRNEGGFILDADASDHASGMVLSQIQDDRERVIAYGSKTMSPLERRYCVTRKELLAVIVGLSRFKVYLYGRPFIIRTDHGSLQFIKNFKNATGQLARWLEQLFVYDFTVITRAGRSHANADGLSRLPCKGRKCICTEILETKETACQTTNVNDEPVNDKQVRKSQEKAKVTFKNAACQTGTNSEQVRTIEMPVVWTEDEFDDAKVSDVNYATLLAWKEQGEKPGSETTARVNASLKRLLGKWDQFVIRNDRLYRKFETEDGKYFHEQLVVPLSLQEQVLLYCHTKLGHQGVDRTQSIVRKKFYWLGWQESVRKFCQTCNECQERNMPSKKPRARLREVTVSQPMERIAMDVAGPFPKSAGGNKYILVVVDYFTKYAMAMAMPDQKSETVCGVLMKNVFQYFGTPGTIHTDQGSNFQSQLFKDFCKSLGVTKTRTTPYHLITST